MKKLTAKNFHDPLVLALANLSGFTAGKAVEFRDAIEATCEGMGITVNQYGFQKGTEIPWTERWSQWAFTEMTKTQPPLTVRAGRGRWALTDHGIAKAHSLSPQGEAAAHKQTDPVVQTDPVAPTEATAYHADPYIRSLAISKTKCFGLFTSGSETCTTCPLQDYCLEAQANLLSTLAIQMTVEANTTITDIIDKALEGVDPVKKSSMPPDQRLSGVSVICHMHTNCKACGKPIDKGVSVVWIRKPHDKAGLLHPTCYDTVVKHGEANPATPSPITLNP